MTRIKKPQAHAYFYEETKQLVNGEVVKDSAIKSEYNGEVIHVDKRDNDKLKHYIIKDKKINKLLTNPISNLGLLERLSTDFNVTAKRKKKRTHKHKHKHKHTHKHKKKHTHKHKHI